MKRERKQEFLKTAPFRINMIVKWIDSLIECSDTTNYHYNERHIDMMNEHLDAALGRLKESYKRNIQLSKSLPFYFNGSDPIVPTKMDNEDYDITEHDGLHRCSKPKTCRHCSDIWKNSNS